MATKKKTDKKNTEKNDISPVHKIIPFVLGILALLCAASLIFSGKMGVFGDICSDFIFGMAGGAGIAVPVLCVSAAIQWRSRAKENRLLPMVLYQTGFYVFLAVLIHMWTKGSVDIGVKELYAEGQSLKGGGFIGGGLGVLFIGLLGKLGTHIVAIPVVICLGILSFGVKPYDVWIWFAYNIKHKIAEIKEERRVYGEERYKEKLKEQNKKLSEKISEVKKQDVASPRVKTVPNDKHSFDADIDIGDGYKGGDETETEEPEPETEIAENPDDTASAVQKVMKIFRKNKELEAGDAENTEEEDEPPFDVDEPKVKRKAALPENGEEAGKAFTEDTEGTLSNSDAEVLSNFAKDFKKESIAKGSEIENSKTANEVVVKREYVFPPINLLKYEHVDKSEDISEELKQTAERLVETLHSFKVETRIVGVSRGPTVTRYELSPKEGVRVRQIANLADDISLNLAANVRIEAPIQGKAAVGVEVPNKTVSTVYLREVLDTEVFRKSASPLNVALGVDVAGEPVYLDIEKMPHLLIAGATGMGKSVCINCVLTSLLYRSSPDDVKLMLIDPKGNEFITYNGLPHLLIPVISDSKKSAGALQWAVSEMQRRFELLTGLGVRDIKSYNQVVDGDPGKEHLCRIVIVIDELADLMLTAPKDVENYIQRLAQKARAAGMHLIIGTQRPSTDVITGTIKGNIPSKIAFTVASQVDSRVILDQQGAEKLIGRGDMLYSPVGTTKPRRVQGAFVGEGEIEDVVKFIKEKNGDTPDYDESIINSIDINSQNIGKKPGEISDADDGGDEGGDPLLRKAVEIAVSYGKMSTSLLQRKLSVGYGKAAKLIDEMEERGIISAPEGQKPRTTLITKQQYMEMFVTHGEDL